MSVSSIVKFRMNNDRSAAEALERAMYGVAQNNKSVLQDVKSGVERASWYSSCLFDKYAGECAILKEEDKRFLKNIFEIYKRQDIIRDMMKMYFNEELKNISNSQIQSLDMVLTKKIADYYGGKATKISIANSLSIVIVNSFNFKAEVMTQLNNYALLIVTVASLYGKVQVAALAARNLKIISPALYTVLYNNNMEMLYFLVSERINKALIKSMGLRGEDRIVSIIKNLT
ncbi:MULTISPECIES: hypothetical protein [unclassified Pantoea]|uniref:hypothetical protein n=1 Tax=unclassified Pantoea TaxID=2630326 RepID=UPI0012322644|nr:MULTISPECIES: hypothetical protein [unclassified Pantoea]KAA5979170.1 hypothetical protein F3I52_04250 [Pantoea sp. M_8]KAA5992057.1 hypothetical protein F3I47_09370 [Pantoea sp. M_10]KAA6002010.1 hypothetical protein F3I50_01985 [Pantoea sp. M_5]